MSDSGGHLPQLTIDGDRLWRSLTDYAGIGATADEGVERLGLSDADREVRDRLVEDARQAGCQVRVDSIGNVFCRRAGQDDSRPPVQIGSHLDTVKNGGRFDGSYGVLAGLEVIRAFNDAGVQTSAPVELVDWTNEEGARFPLPMTGSRVFTGQLALDEALALDDAAGVRLGDELARIGYAGDAAPGHSVGAYLEAHIEQGPLLEDGGYQVGLVTGIQARRRLRVRVDGRAAHAGTCPMDGRQDALVAASGMVLAVRENARAGDGPLRATVGRIQVEPGSANVVPAMAEFLVDVRHPDTARVVGFVEELETEFQRLAAMEGCRVAVESLSFSEATEFSLECMRALREAAAEASEPLMELVSGGGHDAGPLATVAPAGMLFVACRGGVSHHSSEWLEPGVAAAGCEVLAGAVRTLAG